MGQAFDVVVIGGGINGAAVCHDLTRAGYRVLLVEQGDFGGGTSQASTMLIWGGLLYLKDSEFATVRALTRDRDRLVAERPGSVRARELLYVPTPGSRSRALVQGALYVYWLMGQTSRLLPRRLGAFAEQTLLRQRDAPAYAFEEAALVASDARFVLEWILEAERMGAATHNYARVETVEGAGTAGWRVGLGDARTGATSEVSARLVVNAAGCWTDAVNACAGVATPFRHAFSRGVSLAVARDPRHKRHLVFDNGIDGNAMTFAPWGPVALWGSTDTLHPRFDDARRASAHDVELLLHELNRHLRTPVGHDDIVSLRTGVRPVPMPHDAPLPAGTGGLTRHHRLHLDARRPWVSVYGGKLSGCRWVGERGARARCPPARPRGRAAPGATGRRAAGDRAVSDAGRRRRVAGVGRCARALRPARRLPAAPHQHRAVGAAGRPWTARRARRRAVAHRHRSPRRRPRTRQARSRRHVRERGRRGLVSDWRRRRRAGRGASAMSEGMPAHPRRASRPSRSIRRAALRWPVLGPGDEAGVLEVLRDGDLSNHPVTRHLEDDFRLRIGRRHALAHANGTLGLLAAFHALDLQPGDEILVPSATFWASVVPMLWVGAVPVFCEIEGERFGLDPADVEARITARTRAMVLVHLWGLPAHVEALTAIARRHGLAIVEDASHALGASVQGVPCGRFGDIAVFSLQTSKLAAAGEGGMLLDRRRPLHGARRLPGRHRAHPGARHAGPPLRRHQLRHQDAHGAAVGGRGPHATGGARRQQRAAGPPTSSASARTCRRSGSTRSWRRPERRASTSRTSCAMTRRISTDCPFRSSSRRWRPRAARYRSRAIRWCTSSRSSPRATGGPSRGSATRRAIATCHRRCRPPSASRPTCCGCRRSPGPTTALIDQYAHAFAKVHAHATALRAWG